MNNWWSQSISLVVEAKALYSASIEDQATVVCFLDFQETRDSPRNMQKHVTDLQESW